MVLPVNGSTHLMLTISVDKFLAKAAAAFAAGGSNQSWLKAHLFDLAHHTIQ